MKLHTDICVIGGGSAGLALAAGAVQMGARVVLAERGKMGGDCLNYGCVPSKALLASAHAADTVRARQLGVSLSAKVNFPAVHKHVQQVIATIAPHDSVERFTRLGVQVLQAEASCVDSHTIRVGDDLIRAKYIAFATGSRAAIPPIDGLDKSPWLTNETIFANTTLPKHLLVIGGGPIGMEMAHAHAQLGSRVTLLEMSKILPRDDAELVAQLRERTAELGIKLIEGCTITGVSSTRVSKTAGSIRLSYELGGKQHSLSGSHLLVAAGRTPNIEKLDLDKAGVAHTRQGISVDARLRTSQHHIYALGDVTGGPQFTHIAGYHAGIAIRNMLFRLPAKVDYTALPWVTYTDPELAHVGLTRDQAIKSHGQSGVRLLEFDMAASDRAQAECHTRGKIKVLCTPGGKILGVDLLAAHAGELVQPWCLAISSGLGIKHMASYIAPYPTMGELSKRAAGSFYTDRLFSPRTKKLVRFLLALKK